MKTCVFPQRLLSTRNRLTKLTLRHQLIVSQSAHCLNINKDIRHLTDSNLISQAVRIFKL